MTTKLEDYNLREPVSKYMRRDFVALNQDASVEQAEKTLRNYNITSEILYLYVTDDQDLLVGVVPIRNIITADPQAKVSTVMVRSPVSVQAGAFVQQACELFSEHRFLALPVVDDSNKILGIVDINLFTDEVVSLAQQRQVDNVFQLIGVHVSLGKTVSSWAGFTNRFPWLLCNITSGIICAFIASRYELLISEVVVLAMFLTVALAMAESVSIQSMTLTLQTMLQRRTSWRRVLLTLRKEIFTSALLGAGSGIVIGFIAFLWKGVFWQGLAVGISICFAVITACLLGVIIPTIIRNLRVDPKIAAGPIVLASADIATLLFYFTTAHWLLG